MKRSSASTFTRRSQQRLALLAGQRLAEGAGLDVLAQPHALAVGGDVLDLVGDRAAVGLAQVRKRVGERRPRHVHVEDLGRDLGLHLGRQPERLGVEPGSPSGSEPSGSRRAARWPWLRNAADAACWPPAPPAAAPRRALPARSPGASPGGRGGRGRGRGQRGRRARAPRRALRTPARRSRARPAGTPRSARGSAPTRPPG